MKAASAKLRRSESQQAPSSSPARLGGPAVMEELESRTLLSAAPVLAASFVPSANTAHLSWTAPSGSGSGTFSVLRNTTNSSSTANAIAVNLLGNSFTDATVNTGKTYYYWVKAISTSAPSTISNAAPRSSAGLAGTCIRRFMIVSAVR